MGNPKKSGKRNRTKVLLRTSSLGTTAVLALTGSDLTWPPLVVDPGAGCAIAVVGGLATGAVGVFVVNFAAVVCPSLAALEKRSIRARCSARNAPRETTRPAFSLTIVPSGRLWSSATVMDPMARGP